MHIYTYVYVYDVTICKSDVILYIRVSWVMASVCTVWQHARLHICVCVWCDHMYIWCNLIYTYIMSFGKVCVLRDNMRIYTYVYVYDVTTCTSGVILYIRVYYFIAGVYTVWQHTHLHKSAICLHILCDTTGTHVTWTHVHRAYFISIHIIFLMIGMYIMPQQALPTDTYVCVCIHMYVALVAIW